jgi:hypothetical protein
MGGAQSIEGGGSKEEAAVQSHGNEYEERICRYFTQTHMGKKLQKCLRELSRLGYVLSRLEALYVGLQTCMALMG